MASGSARFVRSLGVSLVLFLIGCADAVATAERVEAAPASVEAAPPLATPTPRSTVPTVARCSPITAAESIGRVRDVVACARREVAREGSCTVYDDGLTACYRGEAVARIRLRPCRLSSERALDDLHAAGFDVEHAVVEDTREGTMVVGVPGVWIEGRGRYCYVNPHTR